MEIYQKLEKEFAEWVGTRHAVSVNTGTAALHLSLVALGIGPGDEVLVPEFTFISTAWAVTYTGATPVFYGWDDQLQPNLREAKRKITSKTKAIIVAHIYGIPVDLEEILWMDSIHIVEDCCEAHGAESGGLKVGNIGITGCFSFQETKIIHSGEGGMIVTDNNALAEKLRMMKSTANDGSYRHSMLAFNYRMPNATAKLALKSLRGVNQSLDFRKTAWHIYEKYLAQYGMGWQEGQVAWVYPIFRAVPFGRPFFQTMSSQPMYGNLPNTAPIGTVLPIRDDMTLEDVEELAIKVATYLENNGN